jgi:hypothetical protein
VKKNEYCTCKESHPVCSETNAWGEWLVCTNCEKMIEDSFQYSNHYNGEDHVLYPGEK